MNTDKESIAELVSPSLHHLGVELVDVHWSGKGRGAVLRLVIDRAGGVSLDDCERVSNAVSAVLDAYDPIDASYRLEVSSPGAERPLRTLDEWRGSLGRRVNVRLHDGDAERVVEGRLVAVSDSQVQVEVRDRRGVRPEDLQLDLVSAARVVVDI
ncbi:MAG: ribosome maturation factor RimP [Candidatus Dormibacteraeota bacterium]|nr:ribosome maturation factor RimP [Candidatus Dormibacteraeota bacterium]